MAPYLFLRELKQAFCAGNYLPLKPMLFRWPSVLGQSPVPSLADRLAVQVAYSEKGKNNRVLLRTLVFSFLGMFVSQFMHTRNIFDLEKISGYV